MPSNSGVLSLFSRRAIFLATGMVAFYLAAVCALTWLIARGSGGFSYALDDPYIHLALAQHIRHGIYGVNLGEYSSPSSSILWPFLLVPFADSTIRQWLPLLFNIIPGVALCCLIATFVDKCLSRTGVAVWQWTFVALVPALVLAADLPSLTLIGMEHTLQLLTVGVCAFAVTEAYSGRKIPSWMLLLAALSPAIRYEDLVFTLVVVAACWLSGQRYAAVLTGAFAVAPILVFGFFLKLHGLQFFPNSVVAKSGLFTAHRVLLPGLPFLDRVLDLVLSNIEQYIVSPDRWPLTILAGLLCWLALFRASDIRKRYVLRIAAAGLLVLLLLGPYGWFCRYDVAYRVFALFVVVGVLANEGLLRMRWLLSLSLLTATLYVVATALTPGHSRKIALQQKQLQRFTHDFYGRNIAINDLGWVAFDSRDLFYISDLIGLASTEAAKQKSKDAAWLERYTSSKRVGLVACYASWFPERPKGWEEIGTLRRDNGDMNVTFFVTPQGDKNYAKTQLHRFAQTLPKGAWMTFVKE